MSEVEIKKRKSPNKLIARQYAKEIIATMEKGDKIEFTKILEKLGSSPSNSGHFRKTKAYQEEIAPFADLLEKERMRQFQAMIRKNLKKERYKDLVNAMDTTTQNIQLLRGNATQNIKAIVLPFDIRNKYEANAIPESDSEGQAQIQGGKLWTTFRQDNNVDLRDGGEGGV